MPAKPALSLTAALKLSMALRERGESADVVTVRAWPIWQVRAAWLWIDQKDGRLMLRWEIDPLQAFIAGRYGLQSCRRCGCTEDNACLDPRTHEPCCWQELDTERADGSLCSACHRKEVRRAQKTR
jgi:hypothetical protein